MHVSDQCQACSERDACIVERIFIERRTLFEFCAQVVAILALKVTVVKVLGRKSLRGHETLDAWLPAGWIEYGLYPGMTDVPTVEVMVRTVGL